MAFHDIVYACICVMDMHGHLSRCVDKKIPANAFGRFEGLAADSRHSPHARCPHEQLAYNGLQWLTNLGVVSAINFLWVRSFSEPCAHLLTWKFIRILEVFDKAIGLTPHSGLANGKIAATNGTRRLPASAIDLASDLSLELYPKIEENDL